MLTKKEGLIVLMIGMILAMLNINIFSAKGFLITLSISFLIDIVYHILHKENKC